MQSAESSALAKALGNKGTLIINSLVPQAFAIVMQLLIPYSSLVPKPLPFIALPFVFSKITVATLLLPYIIYTEHKPKNKK